MKVIPLQMPLPKFWTVVTSEAGQDSLVQSRIPYMKLTFLHRHTTSVWLQPKEAAWPSRLVMHTFYTMVSTCCSLNKEKSFQEEHTPQAGKLFRSPIDCAALRPANMAAATTKLFILICIERKKILCFMRRYFDTMGREEKSELLGTD